MPMWKVQQYKGLFHSLLQRKEKFSGAQMLYFFEEDVISNSQPPWHCWFIHKDVNLWTVPPTVFLNPLYAEHL